jgi:membrane peptidoglycan carboxypeptidase
MAVGVVTASAVGLMLRNFASGLPDVSKIEAQFGPRGAERFHPLIALDRTGAKLLREFIDPRTSEAQWLQFGEIPEHIIQSSLLAIDPDFWTNSGYRARGFQAIFNTEFTDSITLRLARTALQPIADLELAPSTREIRARMLAGELTRRYDKQQILTWFLNSASYGGDVHGVEAAALAYFNKHVADLDVEEGIAMASLLVDVMPSTEEEIRSRAIKLLVLMLDGGQIDSLEFGAVRDAIRQLDLSPIIESRNEDGLGQVVAQQLDIFLGPWARNRSGLRVTTTLDADLQEQAECAALSHLERISGGSEGAIVAAQGGSTCVAATLLPALRPKDAGVDHLAADAGVLVTNPESGELLAVVGNLDRTISPGSTLAPYIYLTAFSQGSGPSSMVLDLQDGAQLEHGPVRMRTALANGYPLATQAILELVGKDDFLLTLRQMGYSSSGSYAELTAHEIAAGETPVSLHDLALGYGVFANDGLMVTSPADSLTVIRNVEDMDGTRLITVGSIDQAVLSPQLANLLADVMSSRHSGQSHIYQIGRPSALMATTGSGSIQDLAIGFTPQRLVLAWLEGEAMEGMDLGNGAAAIWHAVIRFSTKDLAPQGWTIPAGVNEMEVCDPSGLLPTIYCPQIVREVFIQGTEPTHYDNLYIPVRINRETGKLATLFTPLELIDEQIFFIPPAGAEQWATNNAIPQPPEEYDTLYEKLVTDPLVDIRFPNPFETLNGSVSVVGEARTSDMDYYRLQYGQGLDPSHWIQIGEDTYRPVTAGRLGSWDTLGLNGLYTLQLLVVNEDGGVKTAAIPVALDNTPPLVQILNPIEGQTLNSSSSIALQVEASDAFGISLVELYIDGRLAAELEEEPFIYVWQTGSRTRSVAIHAIAIDKAGNTAESEVVVVEIGS